MKNYLILFISVVSTYFFGCQKDSLTIDKQNVKVMSADSSNYSDYTINDMSVGEYHNYLMAEQVVILDSLDSINYSNNDSILIMLKQDLKKTTIEDLSISGDEYIGFIDSTCSIMYEIGMSSSAYDSLLNSQRNQVLANLNNNTLEADLLALVNEANVIDIQRFEDLSDSLLNKYESTIYQNYVAMVVDVGLSSFHFWTNVDRDAVELASDTDSIWKADINGAIVGGGWGAVTGSFAGGIGALPGGLLGGSIAASYGSTAAALWVAFG